jgi:hypothetical protein
MLIKNIKYFMTEVKINKIKTEFNKKLGFSKIYQFFLIYQVDYHRLYLINLVKPQKPKGYY